LKWPIEIVNCGAIVPLMILAFPIPGKYNLFWLSGSGEEDF
jgi:hypothetical protein